MSSRRLRRLLVELGPLPEPERQQLLVDRQDDLADHAADLRRTARREWRLPFTSFALGAVGAVWEAVGKDDLITALLALGSGMVGAAAAAHRNTAGAYSYLFAAQRSFDRRSPATFFN